MLAEQVKLLSDPHEKTRRLAMEALWRQRSKSKPVFDEILYVLEHDESSVVRLRACKTLAGADPGSTRLMQALIEALGDKSPGVISEAAKNLGAFGKVAKPALPRLLELVAVGDDRVSDNAASASWRIDPDAVLELSLTLRDDLLHGDPNEQRQAAIALGAIGPNPRPADPRNSEMDNTGPEFERMVVDVYFFPSWFWVYTDPYPRMQGELHPELFGVVADLIKALTPKDATADQRVIIQALGKYQHNASAAVPLLISYLGSSSKEMRVESAKALMRIAPTDPGQVSKILELVNARDKTEEYAVRMLENLGEDAVEHLAWLGEAINSDKAAKTVVEVIEEFGPAASPAVPGLIEFMKRTPFSDKPLVIMALGIIGPGAKEAIPALKAIKENSDLSSSGWGESDEVIKSLVKINPAGRESYQLVSKCLKEKVAIQASLESCRWLEIKSIPLGKLILAQFDDSNASHRISAARAIIPYAIESPDILDALVGLLSDESSGVRAAAYSALVDIILANQQRKGRLEDLLKNEANRDLDYAPLVLGLLLDDAQACELLSGVVSSDVDYMRVFAYEELAARGPAMSLAIPALLEQAALNDLFENLRVAAAICSIDAPQAAPLAPDLAFQLNNKNPEYRRKAAWLLGEIGFKASDALSALESACNDWDLVVRLEAARAIAKIERL